MANCHLRPGRLANSFCVMLPNFVKIGQTIADITAIISALKSATLRHIGLLTGIFNFLRDCIVNLCYRAKYHQKRRNYCGDIAT